MQLRQLGTSDLHVSPLMLGGNVFGWTIDEATSFRILDAFVDAGGNFIDTADVYSRWAPGHTGGESEIILGKWFQHSGKRDQVVLATKLGMDLGSGSAGEPRQGLKPAYIHQAVEASLQRLQTDRIDLYQAHKQDASTPIFESLNAFGDLIEAGKVRHIGASNYEASELRAALELSATRGCPRYQSLQPEYNLVARADYEDKLEPVVQEFGIGCIPYFSLAAGFLTGKYRSQADVVGKARAGQVGKYANQRGFAVLYALDEIAKAHDATPTQVALAWLIAQPSVTAPIASATSLDQLADLVKATELKLDTASLEKLAEISDAKAAA